MKNSVMAALSLLFLSLASQALSLPWSTEYLNGSEICARHQEERSAEIPLWVQVPINYQDLSQGFFSLYAWTKTAFDPKKNTAIFVDGGPGDTSHSSSLNLEDLNIVFFDQRGNSCSRPPTAEQYLNRHFYSSENTARDIDEIRKSLGLQKISVYGVSYGTIPAHLYSALFKDSTRAVVLEGVIFKSDDLTLIENPRRRKILQSFFNSLPANMQLRILEVSQQSGISPHWFSNVGQWMLYLDHPIKTYRNFLDNILWNDDSLGSLLSSFEEGPLQDPDFGFSQVMMNMLACQELGMNSANTGFYSVFSGSKLVAETNSSLREKHCAPLGFQSNEVATIFKASEHPLSVPVTYFQGTLDGATAAPQAVHSFKKAALGPAQLILVKKGGHTPLLGALSSGFESGPAIDLRKKVLSSALQGQDLSPSLLQELSSATELGWQRIQK